jgi:hypothetical protein
LIGRAVRAFTGEFDPRLNRRVAAKVVKAAALASGAAQRRFAREARLRRLGIPTSCALTLRIPATRRFW